MVHVVLLAGGSKKSFIRKQPKCFLDLPTGECIVEEILREIDGIREIEDIVIVGPQQGLQKLQDRNVFKRFKKKIVLEPQGKSMQENIILAKKACIWHNKIKNEKVAEKLGLLYLWADTPFRKRCSVEEFIHQINPEKDLIISWVPEENVWKYYSMFKKPMIPIWMDGRPGNYKETNMAYLNPDKLVGNVTQRFYRLRHTGRFKTMLALRKFLRDLGGRKFLSILEWGILVRQWHRTFRRITPRSFHTPRLLYKRLDKDYVVRVVEESFGLKADIVLSHYPDGFIDVDSTADYKNMYEHFFSLQKEISLDCKKVQHEKTVLLQASRSMH